MSDFELIEALCDIAVKQAAIIKKQAEIISQSKISEAVEADLAALRAEVNSDLEQTINNFSGGM